MLLNIVSIYLFLAIVVMVFFSMYLFVHTKSKHATTLAVLSLMFTVYTFGYLMEIHSKSLEEIMFWIGFEYLALPFLNATWLLMGLIYLNRVRLRTLLAIYAIPILTFFMWMSNRWHGLYYKSYEMGNSFGLSVLKTEKGVWYMVQLLYVFVTTGLIIGIFKWIYQRNKQRLFKVLFLASFLPLVFLVLQVVNPLGLFIDYTVLAMPLIVSMMAIAVIKDDLLEIKSLARTEIFEHSVDAICIENHQKQLVDFNARAVAFFKEQGIELTLDSFENLCKDHITLRKILTSRMQAQTYFQSANERYWEISQREIHSASLESVGRIITFVDVTEQMLSQKALEYQSKTDMLSALNNRHEFMARASGLMKTAQRTGEPLSLLLIDVDHFKQINDTFGHLEGDIVIRKLGALLKSHFDATDVIARFGGEEFIVLLRNTDGKTAFDKAEAFRKRVETSHLIGLSDAYTITVSIGVAAYSPGETLEKWTHLADQGLYLAKNQGRNRVKIPFENKL